MPGFTDIHCHMLSGTDDGARDDAGMFDMLETAYAGGTRCICLTPHFNPMLFGDNRERGVRAFDKLCAYARDKHPDMRLVLGNELYYHYGCIDSLNDGRCRTLNDTRHVLVDFDFDASMAEMKRALVELLGGGYIPVFAHVERYDAVRPPFRELEQLRRMGVVIQVNSTSLCGGWGRKLQHKVTKLLRRCIPDIVASDAHSTGLRHPALDECWQVLNNICGEDYARALMCENPAAMIGIN